MAWLQRSRDREAAKRLHAWLLASIDWLRRRFGNYLVAVLSHADETYPHLHFFCVGDANAIHPGLRAEFEDGVRLTSHSLKKARYRAAMASFLDDYHQEVGSHFDLQRNTGRLPTRRIKDRAVASRVLQLELRMRELQDVEGLQQLAVIVEQAPKWPRQTMRY
jgi:hypothetical protein